MSQVGSTGLNLTCARTLILYEAGWSAVTTQQIEGRIHRRGQRRPTFVVQLMAAQTVEVLLIANGLGKRALLNAFMQVERNKKTFRIIAGQAEDEYAAMKEGADANDEVVEEVDSHLKSAKSTLGAGIKLRQPGAWEDKAKGKGKGKAKAADKPVKETKRKRKAKSSPTVSDSDEPGKGDKPSKPAAKKAKVTKSKGHLRITPGLPTRTAPLSTPGASGSKTTGTGFVSQSVPFPPPASTSSREKVPPRPIIQDASATTSQAGPAASTAISNEVSDQPVNPTSSAAPDANKRSSSVSPASPSKDDSNSGTTLAPAPEHDVPPIEGEKELDTSKDIEMSPEPGASAEGTKESDTSRNVRMSPPPPPKSSQQPDVSSTHETPQGSAEGSKELDTSTDVRMSPPAAPTSSQQPDAESKDAPPQAREPTSQHAASPRLPKLNIELPPPFSSPQPMDGTGLTQESHLSPLSSAPEDEMDVDPDKPALGRDGKLKDASQMSWDYSPSSAKAQLPPAPTASSSKVTLDPKGKSKDNEEDEEDSDDEHPDDEQLTSKMQDVAINAPSAYPAQSKAPPKLPAGRKRAAGSKIANAPPMDSGVAGGSGSGKKPAGRGRGRGRGRGKK
ncbi:hypothetical protein F5878DRAFT_667682 [Lentinula raphanica]|uniref:Helicase C-terminal domain-containing protein n=1 Tax=Lentinula raphanica TaxID=153919 RepID=A0AA38U9L1_9AGAR|nr:hypothetical protein F5878DRAFT_667682 [Lentinula raphanica]